MKRYIMKFFAGIIILVFTLVSLTAIQRKSVFSVMKTNLEQLFAPAGSGVDSEPVDSQVTVQHDKPASVYNYNILFNLIYKFTYDKVGN